MASWSPPPRLYARLGFEHLGPFTLGSSPPLWPVWRAPGTPAG